MNKEQTIGNAKQELSRETSVDMGPIVALEQLRPPLLELRVDAYKTLCKTREQYRHPKDKDMTDFDRQTMLNASVADVEADYQLVSGLEKLVAERIELIKILLGS